ncbi:MAG: heparinase II/III family protein [Bacteroidales bacterium]|nr:heparinase II/III family protein [Bacteroidales bacterium]
MNTWKRIVVLSAGLVLLAGCAEKEIEPEKETTPEAEEMSFTVALPGEGAFEAEAALSLFDAHANQRFVTEEGGAPALFKGSAFKADRYDAVYPYDAKASLQADGGIRITLPVMQEAEPGQKPAPLYVGSSTGGNLSLKEAYSIVKFTMQYGGATTVTLKSRSPELGLGGAVTFTPGAEGWTVASAVSSSVSCKTPSGASFTAGEYYFQALPGTFPEGLLLSVSGGDKNGSIPYGEEGGITLKAGEVFDLGVVDDDFAPEPIRLVIPFHFKEPDLLLDPVAVGSAWPFQESKGSSSNHATEHWLHTVQEGYPFYWSGADYYLNSKGGIQVNCNTASDFFEFPTFAHGRITSITAAFGNLPAPFVTDERGNVLQGGEPKSGLEKGKLYEWELKDTQYGQPVHFVLGTSGSAQILQFNVYYELTDDTILNGISSVSLSDVGTDVFVNGTVDVEAKVQYNSGGSAAGTSCAFDYFDLADRSSSTQLACSPESFACHLKDVTGDAYQFRAWACSEKGWRVYSDDLTVYTTCLKIDFWRDGTRYQPFSPGLKAGQAAAAALAGTEQTVNVIGTDLNVSYYSPKDGTTYYIDLNTTAACRVSSAGTDMSPMSYFKFPAISGKAVSAVVVTRGVASGSNFFICKDPANAESTRVSETVKIGAQDSGIMNCSLTAAGVQYCLVFPDKALYNVRNIRVVYEGGGASAWSDDPDDQTLNPDDPSADPSGTVNYSGLAAMGHPRVLIDKAGFADIRTKVTEEAGSNRFLTSVVSDIISRANGYASSPVRITYTLDASGKRLLTQSTTAMRQLVLLAFAYQVTGQAKYVSACRKILSDVCAFPDWHPSHFLDVAEMSLGVAIAYDWLYGVLTPEEKVAVKNALINYALVAGANNGSQFYNSGGNWNQVCNGGLVAAAIAVYEKDKTRAAQTIEKAISTNKTALAAIYSPDGNYAEGYGYWGYGTGFQAYMMQMLQTAFGTDAGLCSVDGFLETAAYMLFMAGPGGPFSYADGGATSESASPGMWWLAAKQNDRSLLCNEMRLYQKGGYCNGSDERYLPLIPAVVRNFNMDGYSSVKPSATVWSGNGAVPVVMVHTGWDFNANDHYLGIKGGQANHGHGHMDAGSFVYDALGQRWSADVTRPNYATMEVQLATANGSFWAMTQKSLRWDITSMNNWFHSTISVAANDGSISKTYPTDHNVAGKCTVQSVLNSASEKGAVLDMSAVLKGQVASATRTIKLVNEKDLLVIDEITALSGQAAPLLWHMVTPATVSAAADGVTLTSGGKTMYLTVQSSDAGVTPTYVVSDFVRPASWAARTWDPSQASFRVTGYECTVPAGQTVTLTTRLSPEK